jgi:cell division septation protein DedD
MAVRDAERFKDKIEVSLDTRQVVFLFFGGAVLACLVFVLGVMVGKRLEGRERVARKAATSAQVDPLAALDELGADEAADEKGDDLALAAALARPTRAPAAAVAEAPAPKKEVAAEKAADRPIEKPADKPASEATAAVPTKDGKKTRFTLQISSFQDRGEADALIGRLTASGLKPYIVMSNVADKGIFFRVRLGEYASKSDAQDAKAEFEKKQHLLAYVTKI